MKSIHLDVRTETIKSNERDYTVIGAITRENNKRAKNLLYSKEEFKLSVLFDGDNVCTFITTA